MEVGSHTASHEAVAETAAPDLLEAFAERQVCIFGVSGTFKQLAEMCPVDLEDERVTLEAKNDFVIKMANESGIEIEQEFASLFSKRLEELGLERKFTVAETAIAAVAVTKAVEPKQNTDEADAALERSSRKKSDKHTVKLAQRAAGQKVSELQAVLAHEALNRKTTNDVLQNAGQEAIIQAAGTVEQTTATTQSNSEHTTVSKSVAQSEVLVSQANELPQEFVLTPVMTSGELAEQVLESADETSFEDIVLGVEADDIAQLSEEVESFLMQVGPEDVQDALLGYNGDSFEPSTPENYDQQAIELPELPAPVADIEAAFSELAAAIEQAELPQLDAVGEVEDKPSKTREILEAIIALPAQVQELDIPDADIEAHIQEQLEALFVELFEEAHIMYTPELIESFVILARAHLFEQMLADAPESRGIKPQDLTAQDVGTREFLQKLQCVLGVMKQTVLQASDVGSSVLHLLGISKEFSYA